MQLTAIGIASFGTADPNPVSPAFGFITKTPKPGWSDTDLAGAVRRALDLPVGFDTDINGAALGEHRWGAAHGLDTFLYLTIGTGIGGGGMVGRRLMHGLIHPEMGHIRLSRNHEQDPFPGICPFHGDCLEGLACGPALQARWGQSAETLPLDHRAWPLEAPYLALALVNLICTLSPQHIILGGRVMKKRHLLPLIRAEVQELLNGYVRAPELLGQIDGYIVLPTLGGRAGVFGAMALAERVVAEILRFHFSPLWLRGRALPCPSNIGLSLMEQTGTKTAKLVISAVSTLLAIALVLALLVQPQLNQPSGEPLPLDEPYRPQYHFTPPVHWMNDPNGLVYYDGEYHLFYQHNPGDTVWGPMHWGHAVSTDLVNWQHLPITLYPDDIGNIFSGSAVVDRENTAGFGNEALVAIFTHESRGKQMQSLAYSTDRGRTWLKYDGNPVIEPPNNIKNFRDPKVFWYDQNGNVGHWVMLVAAGNIILFYSSSDLKSWKASGGFGLGYGATCGVWETPDLFELPVDEGLETRWVLVVGIGGCAPSGGSGVQYFVGHFDGMTFTSENPKETVLWVDLGPDFYAAQSWNDAPDGRHIWLAWMSNWTYAQDIPTSIWRGAFTLPRELALTQTAQGIRLVQQPVSELQSLRGKHLEWENETIVASSPLLDQVRGEKLEILAEFQVDATATANRIGFRVRVGNNEHTTIGYAIKGRTLFVDRTQSGQVDFAPSFPGIHTAQMDPSGQAVRLHIFVDRSSVEVFGNDGQVAMAERIFPDAGSLGVEVFADGGEAMLTALDIYELDTATFLK